MSLWEYANPKRFLALSERVLPVIWILALTALVSGIVWGFFFTPDDYKQGATVKIIYIHVPAALMAINAWFMMLAASLIWLIRRHHVSALAAKAAAPVGLTFTLIALATGAIWGQPMWGTWWAWDPRLTSFLVLTLFYVGYLALWAAIEEPETAQDLTAVLCLVGSVFAVLSRYAVHFWNQGLHQGSSVMRINALGTNDPGEQVSNVYFYPLLTAMIGFGLLFLALVLLRTGTEIRLRRMRALLAREGI